MRIIGGLNIGIFRRSRGEHLKRRELNRIKRYENRNVYLMRGLRRGRKEDYRKMCLLLESV
jgi:hypothetical protein